MYRSLVFLIAALSLSASFRIENARGDEKGPKFQGELLLLGVRAVGESHACEIRTLALPGKANRTLFRKEEVDIYPGGRLSPCRDRLTFSLMTHDGEGRAKGQFWVLDLAGDGRRIADGMGMITAWSPDSSRIAAYRDSGDGASYESVTIDVATGETTTLDLPDEYVIDDWRASDGMQTAMFGNSRNQLYREIEGDSYPTRQLDLLAADGKRSPLTKNPSTDNIWSRFSPQDDRVAYYSRRLVGEKSLEHAAVYNGDGAASKEIFCFTTYGDERGLPWFRPLRPPAWAPDGSALAWLVSANDKPESQDDRPEILLLPLDGIEPQRIDLHELGIDGVSAIEWR
jgi:hypothetical protein